MIMAAPRIPPTQEFRRVYKLHLDVLAYDCGMSPTEYQILIMFLRRQTEPGKSVAMSADWLAEQLGRNERTIRRALQRLDNRGLLESDGKVWIKGKDGRRRPVLTYYIPDPEWVEELLGHAKKGDLEKRADEEEAYAMNIGGRVVYRDDRRAGHRVRTIPTCWVTKNTEKEQIDGGVAAPSRQTSETGIKYSEDMALGVEIG
jgi:predicted transcriptional regulator